MLKAFEFEEEGRSYSCTIEERRSTTVESWWWFTVSNDVHRYAPFQASKGDTRGSVQDRIVKYYTDLLVRRSRPAEPRAHWGQRNRGASPAPSAPAVPEPVVAAAATAAAPTAEVPETPLQ